MWDSFLDENYQMLTMNQSIKRIWEIGVSIQTSQLIASLQLINLH